ncbi:hypothetical protein LTR27_006596 [Elasticomyces elasticus]|nr:hypothetical protein LTR27_006596 [Elasticomyces elasticus]
MIWCLSGAHGAGPLVSQPATVSSAALGWGIVSGVTTVIGGIAVGLTNQMDYSRFARRPGDQFMGQWVSIIGFGAIMPIFGCLAASSTQAIYGEALWNPPDLVQKWLDTDYNAKSRAAAFFAGFGLVVCLVLSIAMCPWQLLSSAATFISVLSAYSVFLGPWCGIMVCDYWVLRRRCLKLSALYTPDKGSIYFYWHRINWRSYLAWAIGWSYLIPGFAQAVTPSVVVPEACTNLYYLAFPLGFVVSFLAHWAINTVSPPPGLREKDDIDVYGTFTPEEALRLGIAPAETYDGVAAEGSELEKEMGEPKIHSL